MQENRTLAIVLAVLVVVVGGFLAWDWRRQPERRRPALAADAPAVAEPDADSTTATTAQPSSATPTAVGALTCKACGEALGYDHVRVGDAAFHRAHFTCAQCNKVIATSYAEDAGRYFHGSCLTELKAKRCALCSKAIVGGMIYVDPWGNSYHVAHRDEVPRCDYCGRLFAEAHGSVGRRYDDGRQVCGVCLETAITDPERAHALMLEEAARLTNAGLFITAEWIQLKLVDRPTLIEVSPAGHEHTRGVTLFRGVDRRIDVLKKHNRQVYILDGMPEIDARATLAHELTHVWQGELRLLQDADPIFREGSCNYAAYLGLKDDARKEAQVFVRRLLEDPDPIYGEGLRRIKRYVDDHGVPGWIDLMRSENRFPPGY